ncbi:MAG TPA: cellulase family glycosylhydrolase [Chloroflexota bacterium]|nr:cellulase family glycosylhydrolase [Chloroflexota bacterium]
MHKLISSLVLAATVLVAGCQLGPAQPRATSAPRPTATPRARAEPTPLIPAPIVELVRDGRVDSPSPAVHVFLWGNPDTTDRDLKLAKDAGFTWVKQRFEWRNIEKTKKNAFEWSESDRIVAAINKAGLGIIARLDNQPDWARRDKIFPAVGPPDKMEDWKDFVQQIAERYKGKVQAYEIWNEPNLAREWGNAKPDPKAYVEMLRISYQEIKKIDKDVLVISAGLSPTTEQTDRAVSDLIFLKDMYANGARGYFDMLGAHAPGYKTAPETDPADVARTPDLNNNDPSPENLRRAYAFRHAEDVRRLMEDNADQGKQMAIMEMGWTSDPRPNSPYRWHSVTEDLKGDYLVRAIQYAKQNWSPWIGLMTIIYVADANWSASDEQYYWAITNPDGTARPAFNTLKARPR